ncbi:caspase family protein [Microcoleus sp. F8_C2]
MTDQPPNFYALLIGINCYKPNRLSDGASYKNLGGCVRDIEHVEAHLKEVLKVPQSQILKLTSSSSDPDSREPLEPPDQLATYANIVAKFKQLTEMAPADAQVYIHYSGHGGRAKTEYPKIKGGENAIDEGLVPADIGESQYFRDIELGKLLKEMVKKGLTTTVILDCCHSGGATRGDADVRGVEGVDTTPRPMKSLVASEEELAQTWQELTAGSRGLEPGRLLPDSKDYVLLAACRPNELAYEYAFDRNTSERNGALTYWLLDILRQQTSGLTYKDLHDFLNAKIHSQFAQQTPMLIGQGNLEVFGTEIGTVNYTVGVMQVEVKEAEDRQETRILVNTGRSVGLREETSFAIYPFGTRDFSQENRIAVATITEAGATESWCKLEALDGKPAVKQSDQAVLLAASTNLVRKACLYYQKLATQEELGSGQLPPDKLSSDVHKMQDSALQAVRDALKDNKWIELVGDRQAGKVGQENDSEGIKYMVALNESGEYEICDSVGIPYPNLRPALKPSDPDAAQTIVKRLVHLAKYHAAEQLANLDKSSPLTSKLVIEWIGKLEKYDPEDGIPEVSTLQPLDDSNNPIIKENEWLFLRIRNDTPKSLNVAVLDLGSNWKITQIHPYEPGERFSLIESGKEEIIPFSLSLPQGYTEMTDVAKVFATVGEANFRWLELPSLDNPLIPKGWETRNGNLLEDLLASIDDEAPKTRDLNPARYPSKEWTAKQVSMTVKKG